MDQIELSNAGTVLYSGPVVDLIVSNMDLVEKFNLFKQIEKEEEMRPPGTVSPMTGWTDSIKLALHNQRLISNCVGNNTNALVRLADARKDGHYLWEFMNFFLPHQEFTDATHLTPNLWLEKEQEFEQLLRLCPNLTGIHLVELEEREQEILTDNILNMILRLAPNLTSLTWNQDISESMWPIIVQILGNRKGQMQFIDVVGVGLGKYDEIKEWIETNPNLTAICTRALKMDFVKKSLFVQASVLEKWTQNGLITELCTYFQKFNSHYRKSSANGVKLNGLNSWFDAPSYKGLVDSFADLEFLDMTYPSEVDIGQLKVMKNLVAMRLRGIDSDGTEGIEELLPHLKKLTEVHFARQYCPVMSVQTLRRVCQLANLESFRWSSRAQTYFWSQRGIVEEYIIWPESELSDDANDDND